MLIPKAMQYTMLGTIHSAHLGVNNCVARARELMFWPGMASHIRDYVSNCPTCRAHDVQQTKEPMVLREVPERPWQKVAVDLFTHDGQDYLITVDYFSDYFEIDALPKTTAQAVINKLRSHFARHGIPQEVVSDNGPQFTSEEFRCFSKKWEFDHRLTSPYHSQSNGKAEAAVKDAKKISAKAKERNEDPFIMLLERRNTPSPEIGMSSVQRLFSRRTRTLLPASTTLLQPEAQSPGMVHSWLERRMLREKRYYDRGSKELPTLRVGEDVWIQLAPGVGKRWTKGVVETRTGERSYVVKVGNGLYRRNRIHVRQQPPRRFEASKPQTKQEGSGSGEDDNRRTRSGRVYGLSRCKMPELKKGRVWW